MDYLSQTISSKTLQQASIEIEANRLAKAEQLCIQSLSSDPRNAEAVLLLGRIAENCGWLSQALYFYRYFGSRTNTNVDYLLEPVQNKINAKTASVTKEEKYLVSKAWGHGFWSDVSHVLGCALLAELTDRTLITAWDASSFYGIDGSNDAFSSYFKPISSTSIDTIIKDHESKFFPSKWNKGNFHSQGVNKWWGSDSRIFPLKFFQTDANIAIVDFYIGIQNILHWIPTNHPCFGRDVVYVYKYMLRKYLTPQDWVVKNRQDFVKNRLGNGPFVAIHLRGSDKIIEDSQLVASNKQCVEALEYFGSEKAIFLMTDDEHIYVKMKQRYGDRLITTNSERSGNQIGVHLQNKSGSKLASDILLDTFIALQAEKFIGNRSSNVSSFVEILKDWAREDIFTVNKPVFSTFDTSVYTNDYKNTVI